MKFVCPKCFGALAADDNGVAKCRLGHSYDRARGGYYNLLLSSSRAWHGDNREMVAARRAFLDTGAYLPLAERVAELVCKYSPCGNVLDMGCGEGYYTDIIERALSERGASSVLGFDISKEAVMKAAKRNPRLELAVASAYRVPLLDGAVSCAVNMFSPLAIDEVRRVLEKDGVYIMAIPGKEHLFGLKAATYQTPYKNEVADPQLDGFSLVESIHIEYELSLASRGEIKNLFMMTPYAYRTSAQDRERVLSLDSLKTQVEFIIFVYRRL